MALIGWIFLAGVLTFCSFFSLVAAWMNLGKYTIGGAINSRATKVFTLICIAVIVYLWMILFDNAPFTFSMKG